MINKNNYEIYFLDYYERILPAEQVAELFLFLEQHPEFQEEFDAFENIKLTDGLTDIYTAKDFLKKADVNESNVQQFLIAQLEGDLNADELKALTDFLATHKQFEIDKLLYAKTKLNDEAEVFLAKDLLKKTSEDAVTAQQLLIAELEGDIKAAEQKQLNEMVASNPELEHERLLYAKTKLTVDVAIKYPKKGKLKKTIPLFDSRSLIYTISIAASILLFLGIYFYSSQEINPTENSTVAIVDDTKSDLKNNDTTSQNITNTVAENTEQLVASEIEKTSIIKKLAHKKKANSPRNTSTDYANVSPKNNRNPLNTTEAIANENVPEQNPVAHNNLEQKNVAPLVNKSEDQTVTTLIIQQPITTAAPTFANTVTTLASEKFAQLTDNEFFDSNNKNKKLKAITWAVNKIGGSKVKMETEFDVDDKVAAVNVTGKSFSIEHSNGL